MTFYLRHEKDNGMDRGVEGEFLMRFNWYFKYYTDKKPIQTCNYL